MMLPSTPSPESPTSAATPFVPATIASDEVGDDSLTHADYDLQPLLVHSLDHYVIQNDDLERERFHIR